MKFVKELISYEDAKKITFQELDEFIKDKYKEFNLNDCLNKISHDDILSPTDLPSFNKSAMDGYSVIAEDVFGASDNNPIILEKIEFSDEENSKFEGKNTVGDENFELINGFATKVSTGTKIPEGSNAVVMKEYVKEYDDYIEVYLGVHPFENVSKIGEDLKKGDIIIKKGEVITPYHIALLASVGIKKVNCTYLKIGILSTGDELISIENYGKEVNDKNDELKKIDMEYISKTGSIINSNSVMLKSLLKNCGFDAKAYDHVEDNPKEIEKCILKILSENDILMTTGGTSVGDRDYTFEEISKLGEIMYHGIKIRPGRPVGFSKIKLGNSSKFIYILSGYPVAAAVQFELLFNQYFEPLKTLKIPLTRNFASSLGRTDIMRVKLTYDSDSKNTNSKLFAEPLRISGSGVISSLSSADGYVIIDENIEGYEKGDVVSVHLFKK
ncbi:molybdopterin molybdotransferase [Methanococcus voltae]|uniref:molybdopterin molybdotransferase MoeA n=1 Tax=Methanococcus voltae TaxID=2188 RepID=UPI001AE6DF6D|nr:molybdopterin molybdotransferase MoeA [Methanococcus voltae]MBP2143320.1 molybdopterin molybdotransferase [Methanococcus voltae]